MSIDLPALRALLEQATPRPWLGPRITDAWPPGHVGVYAVDEDGEPIDVIGCTGHILGGDGATSDAALTRAAVNALPELLDELERLRKRVSDLEED